LEVPVQADQVGSGGAGEQSVEECRESGFGGEAVLAGGENGVGGVHPTGPRVIWYGRVVPLENPHDLGHVMVLCHRHVHEGMRLDVSFEYGMTSRSRPTYCVERIVQSCDLVVGEIAADRCVQIVV
jgi:hypothetical protein